MGRKIQTLLIAMGANVLLIGTKFLLASVSGSLALEASAWHSFADLFVSAIVLGGLVVAARAPGGPAGSPGRATSRASKIEHGLALFVAVFIFYMAYRIFAEVVGGHEHDLANVGWVALGALVTIGFAYFTRRSQTYVGRQTGSPSLVADGIHSMMDVYSSSVVLAGLLGYLIGFRSLDRVAAVVVVLFILSAGTHILSDALAGLREVGHLEQRFLRRLQPSGRMMMLIAAGLALGYVLSGVYLVGPEEEAVVRRFGRVVRPRVGEGLHYRLPWPVERADKVNVSDVRREGIGVTPPEHGLRLHPPEEVQVLTGDENIVNLKVIVQYRVKDPADFLLQVDYDANPLIRNAIKHALTAVGAGARVDDLLTVGRTELQRFVQAAGQRTLDEYRSGVQLVNLTLQEVIPPKEAADAFRDVASAREERAKAINDAEGYRNSVVPEARGKAERMLREAEGYRADAINRARGDASRFASVLEEYRRSTGESSADVTLYRYYVEAMEKILPRVKKYIVDPKGRNERVNIRVVEPR